MNIRKVSLHIRSDGAFLPLDFDNHLPLTARQGLFVMAELRDSQNNVLVQQAVMALCGKASTGTVVSVAENGRLRSVAYDSKTAGMNHFETVVAEFLLDEYADLLAQSAEMDLSKIATDVDDLIKSFKKNTNDSGN